MLCINQGDEKERGHQVSMMRDIYQSASRVVAWLGPETDGSSQVMQTYRLSSRLGSSMRHEEQILLSRHYWTRIWIVQEICVARKVLFLCGEEAASLPFFLEYDPETKGTENSDVSIYQNSIGRLTVTNFQVLAVYNLAAIRAKFQNKGASLGSLLTPCSQRAATDPRDRVFALLGLADDEAAKEVVPDYSLSPCSVYCSAIRAMFKKLSKTITPHTTEGAKTREVANKCRHDALEEDNSSRVDCDGIECDAWWCCLDIALYDS
ncbi:hypothetical protein PG993_015277 [Apiospora rasikravindrae]|uniref:Heterokaryon incompatibility domain-containing protein n=1 Tax=Apiospora rasikravindrae TaxID=990691 RepID=A0ABR1RS98_9PEZI